MGTNLWTWFNPVVAILAAMVCILMVKAVRERIDEDMAEFKDYLENLKRKP